MFGPGVGIGLRPQQEEVPVLKKINYAIVSISKSSFFNSFIMFIIAINAIVIGVETTDSLKVTHKDLFETLDYLFLSIYCVEFILKFYADGNAYWKNAYNMFDFIILAISLIQVILHQLNVGDNVLKVLRLLRVLRTLRTISFVEGLQVLVTALIDTIRNSVMNVVILLVLLMIFFGVVGYYIFGYEESGDKERWGDLSSAMLTLFTFVTADGWTDIQKRLEKKFAGSQWFTIVFIFLGHFIFTNLFIGIIIMNIHEATERFLQAQRQERETQLKLKKEYLYKRQHDDVRQMLEKQKTSQYTNFEEMTKSFYETLRHDDYVIMTDVSTNLTWLETYLDSLDHLDLYSHRLQQAHRNMALQIAEMAERHYKKQYGVLLPDDMEDAYLPFKPKKTDTKSAPSSPMKSPLTRNKNQDESQSCSSSPRARRISKLTKISEEEQGSSSSFKPPNILITTQNELELNSAKVQIPNNEEDNDVNNYPEINVDAPEDDTENVAKTPIPSIFIEDDN